MTARRLYPYRLTCDRRAAEGCLVRAPSEGTDQVDAATASGWSYRGVAGEVTECWCPPCGGPG